jgi:hypothetical protein
MAGFSSLPYKFNAQALAQAAGRGNPQKENMGMIEFYTARIVPGMQELLSLVVKTAEIPQRLVSKAAIPFLNGKVYYPGAVQDLGDMSVTFLDYVDLPARTYLEKWSNLVYNEKTGLMTPPTFLKTDATFMLFGSDGNGIRGYRLEGVFPLGTPQRRFDFSNGEQASMQINFSVDSVIPLFGV